MAASVRIEDDAFVDSRIELLGQLAGYSRYEALGRMAHLWRVCTQREAYVLDETWITACLGDRGPEVIVKAGLGEKVEGGIRIKGTAGRIERFFASRIASRSRPDLKTAAWRRLRLEILLAHGEVCAYCGRDCSDDPTIDHVRSVAAGADPFDPLNLVVSCRPCNSRKGAGEPQGAVSP